MTIVLKFLELFITFFKIGAFTFGGGYAMLPLIQEAVLEKGWATESEVINFIAVSESTPGPFAINMATYVGSDVGGEWGVLTGILGGFFSTLGVVLPSFIVILVVAKFFEKFKNSNLVQGAMSGLKPTVVGLIAAAVLSIMQTVFIPNGISLSIFKSPEIYISLCIAAVMSVAAFKKVHPIIIICISAAVGIIFGYAFNLTV